MFLVTSYPTYCKMVNFSVRDWWHIWQLAGRGSCVANDIGEWLEVTGPRRARLVAWPGGNVAKAYKWKKKMRKMVIDRGKMVMPSFEEKEGAAFNESLFRFPQERWNSIKGIYLSICIILCPLLLASLSSVCCPLRLTLSLFTSLHGFSAPVHSIPVLLVHSVAD